MARDDSDLTEDPVVTETLEFLRLLDCGSRVPYVLLGRIVEVRRQGRVHRIVEIGLSHDVGV